MLHVHEPQEQLTVVLWKWGTKYSHRHVNALSRALKLYLDIPYRIVCLTDDASGIDLDITTLPLPYEGGRVHSRRLWIFSEEAKILGRQVLQIDLDMVITGDITHLVRRNDPFVVWYCEGVGRLGYALNPSLMLLDTGHHTFVWEAFQQSGDELIKAANREGCAASDQAVITYMFTSPSIREYKGRKQAWRTPYVPTWSRKDGIVNFRTPGSVMHQPPEGACIVSFHGQQDPTQALNLEWVKTYWERPGEYDAVEEVSHG